MNKVQMMGVVALAGALIAGCGKEDGRKAAKPEAFKSGDPNEVVLSVNGKKLTRGQVDADVQRLLTKQADKIPEGQREQFLKAVPQQLVQGFMIENALVGKAKAEGYVVTAEDRKTREDDFIKQMANRPNAPKSLAEFAEQFPLGRERAMEEFENGILIDKMIKAETAKSSKKDYAAEAQKMIDAAISNNNAVAGSDAAALKKIKDLQAQLAKSANITNDFAELAKKNSDCPSSSKGGDLGEFGHGQMVKEFDEAAFKLSVNKVSDPVKTQFGYHLILVTEKKGDKVRASHILAKTAEKRPVPEKAEVIKYLQRRDENAFARGFIEKVLGESTIEACDEFKSVLPPKKAATPVEPTAKK